MPTRHTSPDQPLIPPCLLEMRTDDPSNRAQRNGGTVDSGYLYSPTSVRYANAGDGDAVFTCPGIATGCPGVEVKVDRHDLVNDTMPLTTEALGAVCTARFMYVLNGTVLRQVEVTD